MEQSSTKYIFEEEINEMKKPSSVWFYYLREKSRNLAKCKKCEKLIKTFGGSTSGLHTHLRTSHNVNLLKRNLTETNSSICDTKNIIQPKSKITNYFNVKDDDSFATVLSKMVAVDGIPFSLFVTSEELRKSLIARRFQVPKSASTICETVVKYAKSVQIKIKEELTHFVSQKKISLSIDEWTSVRNRRYICLNLHVENKFWNLGLIRVLGPLPAEKCVDLINNKLLLYDLNLDEDIVCVITDGAAVMKKFGNLLKCHQQLCFAHAIHLAVIDALYKPREIIPAIISTDCESGSNDEDDLNINDYFEIIQADDNLIELGDDLNVIINKIRKVVKIFRRSPTKNDDILQKYVHAEFKKELSLILDTKTRWNSLLLMFERFYLLKDCIRKSLIDLKCEITFSESELNLINCTINALLPIKLAVEALCRRDSTLLSADATILFMIDNLGNDIIGCKLKQSLNKRIFERRTSYSSLLQYLHHGKWHSDLKFEKLKRKDMINMITVILQRLIKIPELPMSVENDSVVLKSSPKISLKEKLDIMILQEVNIKQSKPICPKNFEKTIKKEMAIFEDDGSHGFHLQMVYDYLKTIPPTSVEAERIFSMTGRSITKIRSNLKDNSLEALCILRAHFMSIK